ncbi:MAG: SCO1664 family protein [Tomitella sp.]|nr:SCO1664 family protein [Tomitella sp.]
MLTGPLEVIGRLTTASNATFLCRLAASGQVPGEYAAPDATVGEGPRCVYKPVLGERPLWDFPDGTLADREYASYLISEALGWGIVPRTVLRDGPHGSGMVQEWIDPPAAVAGADADETGLVDLFPIDEVPDGFLPVFAAEDGRGRRVVLAHADDPRLEKMAVLDVLLNNPDRKAGHVLRGPGDRVYGVDHGICLHSDPKLRTVLWGWAGRPVRPEWLADITALGEDLESDTALSDLLDALLTVNEVAALRSRADHLVESARLPQPTGGHVIPWPPF